jgi:hypothetical protein
MQIQISQSNDKINRLEKQHVIDVNDIKVSYAKKDQ